MLLRRFLVNTGFAAFLLAGSRLSAAEAYSAMNRDSSPAMETSAAAQAALNAAAISGRTLALICV